MADDEDLAGAVLRLRLPASALHLFETLKERGHLKTVKEICHNFELSIRAEKRDGENEAGEDPMGKTRLMRVRWDGEKLNDGTFLPGSRIIATLEFDRSMVGAFKILKPTEWASLVPEVADKSGPSRATPDVVQPNSKKLSTVDPSTIVL